MTNVRTLHKASGKIQHRCVTMVSPWFPTVPWNDPWNNGAGFFVPQQGAAPSMTPEVAAAFQAWQMQQMQLAAYHQASAGQPYPAQEVFWIAFVRNSKKPFEEQKNNFNDISASLISQDITGLFFDLLYRHHRKKSNWLCILAENVQLSPAEWPYRIWTKSPCFNWNFLRLASGMASPVMHVVPKHVVPKKATGEEKTTTKRRHGMNGSLVALDIGMICVTSNVGNPAWPIYGRKCGKTYTNYSTVPLCVSSECSRATIPNFNRYFDFIWCCNTCVCAVA